MKRDTKHLMFKTAFLPTITFAERKVEIIFAFSSYITLS